MEWEEKRERRKEPKGAASLSTCSKQPAASQPASRSSSNKRAGEQSGESPLATVTAVQFWPCRKWPSLQSVQLPRWLGWASLFRRKPGCSLTPHVPGTTFPSQSSSASEGGRIPLQRETDQGILAVPEVGPGHRFGQLSQTCGKEGVSANSRLCPPVDVRIAPHPHYPQTQGWRCYAGVTPPTKRLDFLRPYPRDYKPWLHVVISFDQRLAETALPPMYPIPPLNRHLWARRLYTHTDPRKDPTQEISHLLFSTETSDFS